MADDIVARLRDNSGNDIYLCEDAADKIERLRALIANCIAVEEHLTAEIARKDAALRAIAEHDTDADGNWGFFRDEADAALEGEKTDD
jgi:hypothetical protein